MARWGTRDGSSWGFPGRTVGESRAGAGEAVGETAEFEVSVTDEPGEDAALTHVQKALESLRGAGSIQIFRKKPTWCDGYLTTIELGDEEEVDLRQIKADWGGGHLQFRPQVRTAKGMKWAPGGVTVKLTGPPRERGVILQQDGSAPVRERVIVESPRPAAPRTDPALSMMQTMFTGMMGLVQSMMEQRPGRAAPAPAPAPVPAPAPAANPLQVLRDAMKMKAELDEYFGGRDDDDDEPPKQGGDLVERGLALVMDRLDKEPRQGRQGQGQSQGQGQGQGRWRLPNAGPGRSVDQLAADLEALPDEAKMQLLGSLSGKIHPDLIKAWLATNKGNASAG